MRKVKGVLATRVGYTGGTKAKGVHYRSMGDHTEACQVDFDPRVISYKQLLDMFWTMHNPYRLKTSRQYRNCLWYHSETQKKTAQASMAALTKTTKREVRSSVHPPSCLLHAATLTVYFLYAQGATPLEPAGPFWRAEEYHQQCTPVVAPGCPASPLTRVVPVWQTWRSSAAGKEPRGTDRCEGTRRANGDTE